MHLFGGRLGSRFTIIGCGAVCGIGICYALYKLIRQSRGSETVTSVSEDLNLPILLEHDFGDFKTTCEAVDPIASAYLKHIPESFFRFNQELLRYSSQLFAQRKGIPKRALVIGSGVGRLAFDLSTIFEEVKGVDIYFSRVVTCFRILNEKEAVYDFPLEGSHRTAHKKAHVWAADSPGRDPGFDGVIRRKEKRQNTIEFINEDVGAIQSPLHIRQFQLVFVTDQLRESQDPEQLLKDIHRYVETDGLLIIYTDYDWMRRSNKAEHFQDPTIRSSFECLKYVLSGFFNFLHQKYLQDVVGTSLRSCVVRNLHVTVWERNARPVLP